MRLFSSACVIFLLFLSFSLSAAPVYAPDYTVNWLYPGQNYDFSLDASKSIKYIEVIWTDAGGNGVGLLYIGGRSFGARNIGSSQYGARERWYIGASYNGGASQAKIQILNDMAKIYSVNVVYNYQFNQPAQPVQPAYPADHFNNHHDYFDNTGDFFPRNKTLDQAMLEASDKHNDRYNWPGWYEPGRDYKFDLEPNKKIRKIRVRWYCEEGNARVRLYINWHYEGSEYPPKGSYPYYDYIYLWNTITDDSYWNEGRFEIYNEKVYIDRVEVEYDWNYDPDESKQPEPVKVELEQLSR